MTIVHQNTLKWKVIHSYGPWRKKSITTKTTNGDTQNGDIKGGFDGKSTQVEQKLGLRYMVDAKT